MRTSMFALLRAFGLSPIEWTEAVRSTGSTMPSILEVLRSAMTMPAAVVVLLTGDDRGILRRQFQSPSDPDYERELVGQPRLNVVFEAGLAVAHFPKETIFVERGSLRQFTDISGIHRVRISSGHRWKGELRRRLQSAGCDVSDNDAYQDVDGFHPSLEERWRDYDRGGRRHTDLLDREELEEARRSDELPPRDVRAYCLVSSIQEAKDMAYWVQMNRSSRDAALLLTEFLLNSPADHGRPRFRAARALELFDPTVRDEAVNVGMAANDSMLPVNRELLEAARVGNVEGYTRATPHVKSEESRSLLLTEYMQFPRNGFVRLVEFD